MNKYWVHRPYLGLLSAFAFHSAFAASVQIGAPIRLAAPGIETAIPIVFASEGSSVSGIQFDLIYDRARIQVDFSVCELLDRAGKHLYTADREDLGNRVLIAGQNSDALPEGVLVLISVKTPQEGDFTELALAKLTLSNVLAADPDGQPVPVTIAGALLLGRRMASGARKPDTPPVPAGRGSWYGGTDGRLYDRRRHGPGLPAL